MKNIVKNRIAKYFVSLLLIIISLTNIDYAAPLKKGVYKVVNHRDGKSEMYVNEKGKILIKSDPNTRIGVITDETTGENKLLWKYYDNLYESANENWDEEFWESNRTYEGLVGGYTEYYDLDGNKLDFDKDIMAIVNDTAVFVDGTCYNLALKAKSRLNELADSVETYQSKAYENYIAFELYQSKKIYIYDKKLNFIKLIEGYNIDRATGDNGYLLLRNNDNGKLLFLDKNLEDLSKNNLANFSFGKNRTSFRTEDEKGRIVIKEYNYLTDEYTDITSREKGIECKFENDIGNLVSKIIDGSAIIELNDINIKNVIKIKFNDKFYYYVHTSEGMNYIYNENGDRVKTFKDKTSAVGKFLFLNSSYICILFDESTIYVYNNNFELKQTIKASNGAHVSYDDRYYLVYLGKLIKSYKVFDSDFNEIYRSSFQSSFKNMIGKYYFETGDKAKIFDENLKVLKEFDNSVVDIHSAYVRGKFFYIVYYDGGRIEILDSNFRVVVSEGNLNFCNLEPYFSDNISLKLTDGHNYIYAISEESDSNQTMFLYDLNFKEIARLQKEGVRVDINDGYGYYYYANPKGDYILVSKENDYSLYKIGQGYVLNNFYYIGDFENDHFTYANGFNYGLMDFDLNILSQYSVFDTFSDDETDNYWWY
ncbi:MAG: hypothetical protein IKI71_04875 [Lachnospiraceae bacterium]|nr:hypothetical protein [Lachnospiraceae bacterium]